MRGGDRRGSRRGVREGGVREVSIEEALCDYGSRLGYTTLRTLIIVPPNEPSDQIPPHTDSYFRSLYSYLDLLQGPQGREVQITAKMVKVAISVG